MGRYQFGGKKGGGEREGGKRNTGKGEPGGRSEGKCSIGGGENTWVSHEDETLESPRSRPFAEGKVLNQSRESERSLGRAKSR